MEKEIINRIKHIETFYEDAPPGMVQEYEEAPEDCIPDTEANQKARDFLASAPKKGLWMPLGKEVKVMQCWKCKNYGHRTGDKECPLFSRGNAAMEKFREMYEDPMYSIINSKTKQDQAKKMKWLKDVLDASTSEESSSSSNEEARSSKKRKKKKKKKNKDLWVEKDESEDKKKHKKKSKKEAKSHKSDKKRKLSPERDFSEKKQKSSDEYRKSESKSHSKSSKKEKRKLDEVENDRSRDYGERKSHKNRY